MKAIKILMTVIYEYFNKKEANCTLTSDDVVKMVHPYALVVDYGITALICNCDWDIEHGIGIVISESPVRVVGDIGEII